MLPRPQDRPDRQCTATKKGTNRRCTQWAIRGGTVCRYHGGNSPVVQAKAQERLAAKEIERSAAKRVAHLGLEPVEDPLLELSKLASAKLATVEAYGARVNAINDVEMIDAKNAPHIRAAVELYERATGDAYRMLESLVKLGYGERKLRLEEAQALVIHGILRKVIQGLGLTAEQRTKANELLHAEFTALAAMEGTAR